MKRRRRRRRRRKRVRMITRTASSSSTSTMKNTIEEGDLPSPQKCSFERFQIFPPVPLNHSCKLFHVKFSILIEVEPSNEKLKLSKLNLLKTQSMVSWLITAEVVIHRNSFFVINPSRFLSNNLNQSLEIKREV